MNHRLPRFSLVVVMRHVIIRAALELDLANP
jgi:hypothetical protein